MLCCCCQEWGCDDNPNDEDTVKTSIYVEVMTVLSYGMIWAARWLDCSPNEQYN